MTRVGPQRQEPKHLCPSSKVVVDDNPVRSKCVGRRHVTGDCLFTVDCPVCWLKCCTVSLWHGLRRSLNLQLGVVVNLLEPEFYI